MYNNSANTKFTGKSIHFLPSCHSTNTEASLLIRSKTAVNGLIVITNEQTAGRGQQGNVWHSEPGLNLTFSVIFFPAYHLHINDSFYLNIVASLAIAKTLQKFIPEKTVQVKWPNDIYVDNKKICGILIENALRGEHISSIVMGIGLNVNQQHFTLPLATSMYQEAGHTFILEEVLHLLCENLEERYLLFEDGAKNTLEASYLSTLLGMNTLLNFSDADGLFTGTIRGIDAGGKLLIEKTSGEIRSYAFKEVQYQNKN